MKRFVMYNLPALSTWSEKLVPRLSDREYRHAYMAEGVKTWIARQVRALREDRNWSQGDLARESGKKQSAISRIEDPDYGQLSLQTLFDLAAAFDLPLLVQFAEWPEWLNRMEDVSIEALQKSSFDGEHMASLSTQQYINTIGGFLTTYAGTDGVPVTRDYDFQIDNPLDLSGYYDDSEQQLESKSVFFDRQTINKIDVDHIAMLNHPPQLQD